MRKVWIVIAIFVGGGGACHKSKPAPFTGPLTVDLVMASKDLVQPLDSWDDAFATLQGKVGAPTKIDGKKYEWAAMKGDDCAYFEVEKTDGAAYKKDGLVVGMVQNPMTFGPSGAIMNRAECLELVGKGVPEDPNVAPPPTDGSAVQVQLFLANAIPGRAKWEGKQVRVVGMLNSTMGNTMIIYDLADTDRKKDHVECALDAPETRQLVGQTVIAAGTVKLTKVVTGDGKPGFDLTLEHCALQLP
jgi:hypothetical protein